MSAAGNSTKLNSRVSSLMQKEKYQDAIKLLEKEISNVEEDWRLFWNFGWCYFQLEQLDNAQQKLIKALELSPKNPVCKWALGTVYREKEDFEKAEILLSEALQTKESYMVRLSLALTLIQQRKI